MTHEELNKILSLPRETPNFEFKECSANISILGKDGDKMNKKSLYGYCAALGNEGGGKLILGVSDKINFKTGKRDIVGTNAIQNFQDAEEKIFNKLGRKIKIEKLFFNDRMVQIVSIPSHPIGAVFRFYGIPLMRNGEELKEMDDETLRILLNEERDDFSAKICEGAKFEDLNQAAIERIRRNWIEKIKQQKSEQGLVQIITNCSEYALLEKLGIIVKGKITNAGILLMGKEDALAKYIPNAEIIFEYRVNPNQIHYDFRFEWRKAYVLMILELEKEINARNMRTPFKQGFFELDIWAFDLWSYREAINNAFAHREYFNRTEPIFIKMSPEGVLIKSPGSFLPGVNLGNVLDIEGKWRNRILMEALQKIGAVERSGLGLDRIFIKTISDGKGLPDFIGTNKEYVILNIPAKIRDLNFVYYLQNIERAKQINFITKDFIYLQKIKDDGKIDNKERLHYFFMLGIIEKVGRSRGQKYILSKNFYEFIDNRSEYTRKKWLSKEQQKQVLVNYFQQHKKGRVSDFKELFENRLSNQKINILLNDLREMSLVYFDGKPKSRSAYWKIF
ncbi:MAG: ATP-binding protein [bacterium]